ncbi:hypothetical protein ABWH96_18780 [Marivirga tractuosa]|uniref:hypothetical protein n=1 Tax=Marivirga tractuosa TaxID=1006 RepID=UPI0035CF375A
MKVLKFILGFIAIVLSIVIIVSYFIGSVFFFYGVIIRFIEFTFDSLDRINDSVLAAIISAVATIVVGFAYWLYKGKIEEDRKKLEDKKKAYHELLTILFNDKNDFNEEKINSNLIVFGSTEVFNLWYQNRIENKNELIVKIGEELGHKGSKFSEKEIRSYET